MLSTAADGKKPASAPSAEQIPDAKIMQTLAKYLWMKDNFEFRMRVIAALGFLVGAKVNMVLFLVFLGKKNISFSFLFLFLNGNCECLLFFLFRC